MNKTKIEWCDYTVNPVKGLCPMACPYCYARAMYKRFKWNPEIRYEEVFYYSGIKGKPGDKYFVGSTMELFGDWIPKEWLDDIFRWVNSYPQRTFIFLTKQPWNLIKFSPFPDNCWVGVTATDRTFLSQALYVGLERIEAKVKFISFEPLLGETFINMKDITDTMVNWVIIGAQTKPYKPPKWEWVEEIIEACVKAGIPYFLKNNLEPIVPKVFGGDGSIIQEMPSCNPVG